jgi:hypothetical protein
MNNKILSFAAAILFSSFAFAYNTHYFNLKSGSSRHILVYNLKPEISLKWQVHSHDGFAEPTTTVINQDNGFECKPVRNILLFSGYNAQTKIWTQTWEIRIQWSPGADSSGCLIEVSHPEEESVQVDLYMNY